MIRRQMFTTAASLLVALGAGGGLVLPGMALAADPANRADETKITPTASFVQAAVVGNLFEVESSKLAADRAEAAAVKTFAKQMVDDHSAAGVKITEALTESKLTKPPFKLDAKHQATLDELAAKKGRDFDRAYVDAQLKAHVETVALFEGYAASGEDPRLKALAGELLPKLKAHLAMIEKIAAAKS